jgi:hypothetical protein
MKREAIYHIPNVPYAYGLKEENLYLKIRTAKKLAFVNSVNFFVQN